MGTCIEELSDRSYVARTGSDNQVFRRNREFLKPALQLAEQPKPVKGSDSQLWKSGSQPLNPKQILTPQTVAVEKTRTRVVKSPSRFSDFVVWLAMWKLTLAQENLKFSFWRNWLSDSNFSNDF